MNMYRETELRVGLPVAAALALLSSSAMSEDAVVRPVQEVIRVTAPRPEVLDTSAENSSLEAFTQALIEDVERRVANDLAKSLESFDRARIELVIAEVPTRG